MRYLSVWACPFHNSQLTTHNSQLNSYLPSYLPSFLLTTDYIIGRYIPLQAVINEYLLTTLSLLSPFPYIPLLQVVTYLITALSIYYQVRNAQPTVLHRFMLFSCVSMDYMGVGCPYILPKRTAQPFHDIFLFLYFPILQFLFPHYSRIIFLFFST